MSANYEGPYWIGMTPYFDSETKQEAERPRRHNDGSMSIMGRDSEGDNAPVLYVPMRVVAKRGEAWRTTDLEQEAFAAAIVALLNAN